METRLLEYFLTVARERNITRSAELLHITQPTLSRQLVQLEEQMGQQLIIRQKRGIQLTEAGLMLQRRAEEIIQLVNKTEEELRNEDEVLVGSLVIGTGETEASFDFLPTLVQQFHELYPLVNFEFYTGDAMLVKEKINQGIIDIGILLEPVDIASFEFFRLPYQDLWGVVVPNNHPLASKPYVTSQDLRYTTLCFNEKRALIKNEIQKWAKDDYQTYQFNGGHNLISNILPMVEKGFGLALTIKGSVMNHDMSKLTFIPLAPAIVSGSVLVWKKHQIQSSLIKRFLLNAKEVIQQKEDHQSKERIEHR